MDPKDVIRRSWENRDAKWPEGADQYYVPAYVPFEATRQPPSPEDLTKFVPWRETVVEFRRERSIDRQGGYHAARIVGSFKGEELTVDQYLIPPPNPDHVASH